MTNYYKLNPDKSVSECSMEAWGRQRRFMRETNTKHVAYDIVKDKRVSTVWLGLDHQFTGIGSPLLFETIIFNKDLRAEQYCHFYSTWDEALAGHEKAKQWVLDGCKEDE